MAKLRSFYGFDRLVENVTSYNELLREFPEFNLLMNTNMSVITSMSQMTDGKVSLEDVSREINQIKTSALSQKAREAEGFIGELIPKIDLGEKYKDVTDGVKNIAGQILTEVKKLSGYYDKLIQLNPDEEVRKDIDNLVSMWCDVNNEIIKKNQAVSESFILEKNMAEVFDEDLVSIKIKLRSLLSDIDNYLKNKNVRTSSRLKEVRTKASEIMDEVQDGVGYGQNWNNFSRREAKERIDKINSILNELVSKYTEIVFSEKDFSQEYTNLVAEINATCNKINSLLKKMTQKSMEALGETGIASTPSDLAWGIIDPDPTPSSKGVVIGIFKKRKWIILIPKQDKTFDGTYRIGVSLHNNSDSLLYKEQKTSIQRDDSTWLENQKMGADWKEAGWAEVTDSKKIDFFNKCLQYQLVEMKRWVCKNSKPLYNSSGEPNFSKSEREDIFTPSEADIEKFDPVKAVEELKKFPNYTESYLTDSVELTPDNQDGGGSDDGGGSGDDSGDNKENYYHTDKIKAISFIGPKRDRYYNDLPNKIDGGPNRTWYRGSDILNTKWFKTGTFSGAPSDWWMRIKNGIWEVCRKGTTEEPKEGKDEISSLNQKFEKNVVEEFVILVNKSNEELADKIREQNQISKYWGTGAGKTNVKTYPWGQSEGAMKVEKEGTPDERCGGTISPSAWGRSSVYDDVILYFYKNGNFEIGDDDYEDRIWGNWGIDSDKNEFFIKWDLYATSSTKGWKSIKKGVGKLGQVTLFTGPISDGLKPVLDKAAIRFMQVFY